MEINLGADTAGLYAMELATGEGESSKESGESDCDFGEKKSKKEGKLGAKKKTDKEDKDKKKDKDKGYAALDGESSPEELEMELKSPFKGKKRSFKFSSRKEKKTKESAQKKTSKETENSPKETKDDSSTKDVGTAKIEKLDKKKEKKSEKEVKKEKEKSKEKTKLKINKDKKKKSHPSLEEDLPIFGAPLDLAVERSRCHDGIDLPVVVRHCIDYMEDHGLQMEGIYRSSGLKTRVVELRRAYNNRENVELKDVDPPVVASLLKQFLRELPDNILTNEFLPKFDEVSSIKDSQQQGDSLCGLIRQLPPNNKLLVSWLMIHMEHVIEKERFNKMNVQNLSIVLCPTLNLSHRVLGCLFAHSRMLFSGTQLTRYIPPLSGVGVSLPDELSAMARELKKQESLLAQIHGEMNVGSVAKHREEQLWEAQRIVTQLKRQLKLHAPSSSTAVAPASMLPAKRPTVVQNAHDDRKSCNHDEELRLELALPTEVQAEEPTDSLSVTESSDSKESTENHATAVEGHEEVTRKATPEEMISNDAHQHAENEVENRLDPNSDSDTQIKKVAVLDSEKEFERFLIIENEEREKIISQLNDAIEKERKDVERLQELLAETTLTWTDSSDEDEGLEISEEEQEQLLAEVLRENRQLEEQNMRLQTQIEEAREECLKYRVQLRIREEKARIAVAPVST